METITCAKELAVKVFYWFTITTKRASLSCGNQNGFFDNLIKAPPYNTINK